jgi:hypothetical protein
VRIHVRCLHDVAGVWNVFAVALHSVCHPMRMVHVYTGVRVACSMRPCLRSRHVRVFVSQTLLGPLIIPLDQSLEKLRSTVWNEFRFTRLLIARCLCARRLLSPAPPSSSFVCAGPLFLRGACRLSVLAHGEIFLTGAHLARTSPHTRQRISFCALATLRVRVSSVRGRGACAGLVATSPSCARTYGALCLLATDNAAILLVSGRVRYVHRNPELRVSKARLIGASNHSHIVVQLMLGSQMMGGAPAEYTDDDAANAAMAEGLCLFPLCICMRMHQLAVVACLLALALALAAPSLRSRPAARACARVLEHT